MSNDKLIDSATDEAVQDRLLEATPAIVAEVPASLDALLELHGMDPQLDSRRWTSNAPGVRQARILRDCHAGLAPVLAAATALVAGADAAHVAAAMVAGAIGAAVIARSHRAAPGRKPVLEAAAGTAIAASVVALVAVLPAEPLPIGAVAVTTAGVLAGVIALGAGLQCAIAVQAGKPLVARTAVLVAAVAAVLAI